MKVAAVGDNGHDDGGGRQGQDHERVADDARRSGDGQKLQSVTTTTSPQPWRGATLASTTLQIEDTTPAKHICITDSSCVVI